MNGYKKKFLTHFFRIVHSEKQKQSNLQNRKVALFYNNQPSLKTRNLHTLLIPDSESRTHVHTYQQ